MNWRASLSDEEADEIFKDLCDNFNADIISEKEFRLGLAKLGYNATDIEDNVKFYRPSPSEDTDGT
jgi:hypothetical protein